VQVNHRRSVRRSELSLVRGRQRTSANSGRGPAWVEWAVVSTAPVAAANRPRWGASG
jgi:hypothetical protein